MSKRALLIGLLVVGVALLSGCDLLDQFIEGITGGGIPGGGTGTVVSGNMGYNLRATVSLIPNLANPVRTIERFVGVGFSSGGGSYDPNPRKFIATSWDGGDFSNTYFEARLNAAEDTIEYFYARQTRANVWFAWTFVHEIRGYNVSSSTPPAGAAPGGHYFILKGLNAHATIDLLTYRRWPPAREGYSLSNPETWVNSHNDIIPSADNVITIRLDY